jgi:uncharacterized protein (TIGR00290 family)
VAADPRPRVLLAWSSGKDSAWALEVLRHSGEVEVVALLTAFNREFDRVAMHAVRRELVEAQARSAGLPLLDVPLPWPCTNDDYEAAMAAALAKARAEHAISQVAFGDLFLEDVRQYRESRLRETGLAPLFPLWGLPTPALARDMVRGGLKARITCVDPRRLDPAFAGRGFDAAFLDDLPDGVDPCGEYGEFHSFAHEGPMFARPIPVQVGEIVARDGFVFADLLGPEESRKPT